MDNRTHKHLLQGGLNEVDPFVARLIQGESEQQLDKLILVPSVSAAPDAVLQALGSPFQNVCAEGHPSSRLSQGIEADLADVARHLATNRRYANRRFYKGVNYVDLIESLAQRRGAALFSQGDLAPEHLFVNVQALSGGTANLAVYQALMSTDDTLMGMSLTEGGHLSHGATVNLSGQLYRIVSYGVDLKTERLDYEAIRQLALRERPRLIIAGFTSYPWQPDWAAFRAIADEVDAYLVADIAHTAGLVIAGVMPNPVGIADVTTLTTNKTMLGPRSAVVISTESTMAQAIDNAIFPGAQGAPHPNKFAAVAVTFGLAATEQFKALQRQIASNAQALANGLEKQGIRLVYGGTNTHLFVIDLKSIPSPTGYMLYGEPASRILELAGVVVNRNTIPGDESSALATGLRMGTPWLTQRGLVEADMERLAELIYRILSNIHPFTYNGLNGLLPRGKIDFEVLTKVQQGIAELAQAQSISDIDNGETAAIYISGQRARQFVQQLTTTNIAPLLSGEGIGSFMLDRHGKLLTTLYIHLVQSDSAGDLYCLISPDEKTEIVHQWLSAVSDGYVLFDNDDIWRKVEGPVLVEAKPLEPFLAQPSQDWFNEVSDKIKSEEIRAKTLFDAFPNNFDVSQPYFVGQAHLHERVRPLKQSAWQYNPPNANTKSLRQTALHDTHVQAGAKMTPFAGWHMPLRYDSIGKEHQAVRTNAGLFDVSHMGLIEISGPAATTFLDVVFSNYVARLDPGQSCYGYILDIKGQVIDDAIIYCLEHNLYWMVVNAANAPKVWDWLSQVNIQQVIIDHQRPWTTVEQSVNLRNLKNDPSDNTLNWQLLALQGPASQQALNIVLANRAAQIGLRHLERQQIFSTTWQGTPIYIARTGYTGEEVGYEIFVTAETAPQLWNALLNAGVTPVGLAARDSLRIEAGLPLWGQELAGPLAVSPIEAGFEGFVKYHKPFFVGRQPLLAKESARSRTIIRFQVDTQKARRPYFGDPVLDERGRQIGQVTSCSLNTQKQLQGLALVGLKYTKPGMKLAVVPLRGRPLKTMLAKENQIVVPIPISVLTRFTDD